MRAQFFMSVLAVLLFAVPIHAEVLIDARWTTTDQVNVEPFALGNNIVVGVNFINSSPSSPGASTLKGVAFDDVLTDPGGGLTYNFGNNTGGGSFNLTANGAGPTLETRFGFFHTRHDNGAAISGTDAGVANTILEDIHVICTLRGDGCGQQEMTVGNLSPNRNVYLQFFGGDEGWSGQLDMVVNGVSEGIWTTNANENPSTFGFTTTTNAAGELDIDMNITAGNFSGVSAFFVIEENAIPEPSTLVLAALGMFGLLGFTRRRCK